MLRVLILLLLVGCEDSPVSRSESSIKLGETYEANNYEYIDFSTMQGNKWTKVCFLGPYNTDSEKALGFSWDVSKYTDVLVSDSHNVILFATDSAVLSHIVHSRSYGDFWQLSGKCFPKESSKLYKSEESGAWYAGS